MADSQLYTSLDPLELKTESFSSGNLLLEPLLASHTEELCTIIDPDIWKHYPAPINDKKDMENYIRHSLKAKEEGTSQAYIIRLKNTNELIGSSRFMNIDKANRRVEIGSTWYLKKWQRTFVNTECKLLMLNYAFEKLNCICVEFRTDSLNTPSRKAIERIGAKPDGILRNHRICNNGRIRHTAVYSIVEQEWSNTKKHIISLINKYS